MTKTDKIFFVLLVSGILSMVIWMVRETAQFRAGGGSPDGSGIGPGEQAPPIKAAGWFNGKPPTAESLRGKVIVVDAWAYWCGPCRAAAPELVAVHDRYRERGVVFIGLTSEEESSLEQSRDFVKSAKIPWVNGYGAVETLTAFGAESIPSVWVIDRNGQIAWNSGQSYRETIETALDRALAAAPTSTNESSGQEKSAVNID